MQYLYLILSIILLLVGHLFRLRRWEQFIGIYEQPAHGNLLQSMALGYAVNFLLPFHIGDLVRGWYSGKKMRNGAGFSFATIWMDRFLDVWVVTAIFAVFYFRGVMESTASLEYYVWFSLGLVVLCVAIFFLRDALKKLCLNFCNVFNDQLRLKAMMFFWSLIHTFKDLSRIRSLQLLANTLLMWATYLASYASFARCLSLAGNAKNTLDVFSFLFGENAVSLTTFASIGNVGTERGRVLMILWLVLPLGIMALLPLLPKRVKKAAGSIIHTETEERINLIPQNSEKDRIRFLTSYFNLKNKAYVGNFLEINEHITILQDYSAGSNATTMLCMDREKTFFRKYASGADADKLQEQLAWLENCKGRMPLCEVLRSGGGEGFCWYDMAYEPDAVDMFRFIHSNPMDRSRALLRGILDRLGESLYSSGDMGRDSAENIQRYLHEKVERNLDIIQSSRTIRELIDYDELIINGNRYPNLHCVMEQIPLEEMKTIFAEDPLSVVHGDLTVENIICRVGNENGWYLIDPNTGNVHETYYLDYAKLLQSLHGSYEFFMRTNVVSVSGNRIDFQMTRSAAYDALLDELNRYIRSHVSKQAQMSIALHEMIHWLRLMPYKLRKDKERAPMFYAGLVMVANDVQKQWNEWKEK